MAQRRQNLRTYWVTLLLLLCLPAMGLSCFWIEYNMQQTAYGRVDMDWRYTLVQGVPLPCDEQGQTALPAWTADQRQLAETCLPPGARLALWVLRGEERAADWLRAWEKG